MYCKSIHLKNIQVKDDLKNGSTIKMKCIFKRVQQRHALFLNFICCLHSWFEREGSRIRGKWVKSLFPNFSLFLYQKSSAGPGGLPYLPCACVCIIQVLPHATPLSHWGGWVLTQGFHGQSTTPEILHMVGVVQLGEPQRNFILELKLGCAYPLRFQVCPSPTSAYEHTDCWQLLGHFWFLPSLFCKPMDAMTQANPAHHTLRYTSRYTNRECSLVRKTPNNPH